MGQKILIIDDTEQDRKVTEIILKKSGYTDLIFAEKSEEGIKMAIDEKPDLILLDINMPGADGPATHNKLKESPQTKNIPIIFMSNLIIPGENPAQNQVAKMDNQVLIKKVKEIIG